jgi:biopolymer transport protein ExbD
MRRFSQRNALVTLSDINITPLLDLAFVLLIIFVIISPHIRSSQENGMELNLPQGGGPTRKISPNNVRVVEISVDGRFKYGGKDATLPQIEQDLIRLHQTNPNLVVWIRVDETGANKHTFAVFDVCMRNGIALSAETDPRK